ncbi:MAG: hypothetical protein M3N49_00440 [Candidatus Eremiobacteraeota bacterium]|nr:hypothetical protein [Candidatus Eremiobacteraeota bacterium]
MSDPTPLPVRVVSEHGNWWLDVFVAIIVPVASLLVASLAALFAGLALIFIGKQIKIANQQTALAQLGIDWAKRDYETSIENLKLTQAQAAVADAERARTPDLRLSVEKVSDDHGIYTEAGTTAFSILFSLVNVGPRVATNITMELLFPQSFKDRSQSSRFGLEQAGGRPFVVFGHLVEWGKSVGRVRLENNIINADSLEFEANCVAPPGQYRIGWIAKTAEGMWPQGPDADPAGFGYVELQVVD